MANRDRRLVSPRTGRHHRVASIESRSSDSKIGWWVAAITGGAVDLITATVANFRPAAVAPFAAVPLASVRLLEVATSAVQLVASGVPPVRFVARLALA